MPLKKQTRKKSAPCEEIEKQGALFIMPGKKGMKHYSREVKLEAVCMFFEEGMTRAEVTKVLGLRSSGRVEVWTRQYRRKRGGSFH